MKSTFIDVKKATILGCKLANKRTKKRIIKKYLNRYLPYWRQYCRVIGNLKKGDLFYACNSTNEVLDIVYPYYSGIGVLTSMDVYSARGGGHDLTSCGVWAAVDVEELRNDLTTWLDSLKDKDPWNFRERFLRKDGSLRLTKEGLFDPTGE